MENSQHVRFYQLVTFVVALGFAVETHGKVEEQVNFIFVEKWLL